MRVQGLGVSATNGIEVFVKRLGLEAFIPLFLALVVTCAFHAPHVGGATPVDSDHAGSFCGIMQASIELTIPPSQPALQADSDEAVQPPSDILATWSLAYAIDHPPRSLGRSV
jgi:hypothetical protein